jgi:hypothetical protein
MTVTATATALAVATKVEGNVWVTWQLLAAAGEDSWWRWISLSLSAQQVSCASKTLVVDFPPNFHTVPYLILSYHYLTLQMCRSIA